MRHLRPGAGADRGRVLLQIIEKYDASDDELFRARCIHVKEERAELVKHHIDVLWHDYFKPEHLEKYPDLHDVCWKASKAASKVKQSTDIEAAKELLGLIDKIDEMWRATGGPEKTRVQAVGRLAFRTDVHGEGPPPAPLFVCGAGQRPSCGRVFVE